MLRFEDADGAVLGQDAEIARDAAHDYHRAYATAMDLGGGLLFGNALLSRYPILEQRAFELPGADQSDQRRALLYALVDAPAARVPVFVTHLNWPPQEGAIRCAQARRVAEIIDETAPPEHAAYPPILMGDMNAPPDSDEMRFVRGLTALEGRRTCFADAFEWVGEGPGMTFDRSNAFALESHAATRRIDYIFVRGLDRGRHGEPLACRVVLDAPFSGVWPSDHFGVYAELAV